ncbi:MAG: hypothetical protein AVDCRST_MAG40-1665, partial [uncultured Gemmatimonadaceae bacterium]
DRGRRGPLPPARPARRGAAARPHRRAHAARRARGELLVPPAPRRLRVDRPAGPRAAGGRHGLRGGLRLRRPGPHRPPRDRRGRQSGGPRARAAALRAPEPHVRPGHGRALRRARRRGRLPADDRARAQPRRGARALQGPHGAGRPRGALHAERPDPRARGRGEVGQSLAPQGVPRRGVPGAVRGALRAGGAPRPLPRAQARPPRLRARAPALGRRAPQARDHEALLRPLHPGAGHVGLRAARGPPPR